MPIRETISPEEFNRRYGTQFKTETISAEEFKRRYGDQFKIETEPSEGLSKRYETPQVQAPETQVQAPQKKESFLEQFLKFIKGEITGQPVEAGFWGSLFQHTLGSKGLLGVGQLPGKTIAQPFLLRDKESLQQSIKDLSDSIYQMIQRKRQIADPKMREKYDEAIKLSFQTLEQLKSELNALEKNIITPSQAAATTIRGLTTVASAVIPPPASVAQAAGIGAGTAGAYSLARGLEEQKTPKQILKEMAFSSAIGAALGAGSYAFAEKVLKPIANTIYRYVMRYSSSPDKATREMAQRELVGSTEGLLKKIQPLIEDQEEKLREVLATQEGKITLDDITETYWERLQEHLKLTGREDLLPLYSKDEIKQEFLDLLERTKVKPKFPKEGLTYQQVINYNRELRDLIRDSSWRKLFIQPEELSNAQRNLTDISLTISQTLRKKVPEVAPILDEYSSILAVHNGLQNLLFRSGRRMPITALDLLLSGVAYWSPTITAPEVLPIMIGRRFISSTAGLTGTARAALALANLLKGVSSPEVQTVLGYLISSLQKGTKK